MGKNKICKCENCECNHNGEYGSGRFCSSKCARGFSTKSKRKEINVKTSQTLQGRNTKLESKGKRKPHVCRWCNKAFVKGVSLGGHIVRCERNPDAITREMLREKKLIEQLSLPWESISNMRLKRLKVLKEQNGKCNKCGVSEWQGETLTLELEHKDGNNKNNSRDNLEFLCPNCHSQTSTWRGRNKNNFGKKKVSDEHLLQALYSESSIRQALLSVGLAAKGGNYERAYKLLKLNF